MKRVLFLCLLAAIPSCVDETPPEGWPRQTLPPAGAAGTLWVSGGGDDSLYLVDVESLTLTARIPVGQNPVSGEWPMGLSLGDGHMYFSLSNLAEGAAHHHGGTDEEEEVLDPGWLGRVSLATAEQELMRLGENPVALLRDEQRLWVGHFDHHGIAVDTVWEIDLAGWGKVRSQPMCRGVTALAVGAGRLVAPCYFEDGVASMDLATRSVSVVHFGALATDPGTPPRHGPFSLLNDGVGGDWWVGQLATRSVVQLDSELETLRTIAVGGDPRAMVWIEEGKRLAVAVRAVEDLLVVVDVASGDTASHVVSPECDRLGGLRAGPHPDEAIYLLCAGRGEAPGLVARFDTQRNAIDGIVEVGRRPSRMVWSP